MNRSILLHAHGTVRRYATLAFFALTTVAVARVLPDSTTPRRVRSVSILGNLKTNEVTILRELTFAPGDSIAAGEVLESQQRVYNLGLFNSVTLTTTIDTVRGVMDVFVVVAERWYLWPELIVGVKDHDWAHMFTHSSKLFAGLGVLHSNVRGRNEKLFVKGVGGYDPNMSLEYDYLALGTSQRLLLSGIVTASRTLSQNDTTFTHGFGCAVIAYVAGVQVTYRETQRLNVALRIQYSTMHATNPAVRLTLSPTGTDALPSVALSAVYDSRDHSDYATEGWLVSAALEKIGASEQVNFAFASLDSRSYLPLYDGAALCWRGAARMASGGAIPLYAHQILGLGERVRGQFGARKEGEDYVIGSIEARLPLFLQRIVSLDAAPVWIPTEFTSGSFGLYATFFTDVGTTWYRVQRLADQQWLSGVGTGLNILGPYGFILRLEYALHGSIQHGEFIFDFNAMF